MTDWKRPFRASYRFMRVDRRTGRETARLDRMAPGGSIERNQDKTIKEGGSLRCVGPLDLGPDLLRVYLDAAFDDGSRATEPLGTFLVRADSRSTDGVAGETAVELLGRLAELDQSCFGRAFTVPVGTDLVARAAEVVEGAGLMCVAESSTYRSKSPLYYGIVAGEERESADGSKLTVVNDLLQRAGFASAWTDAMGVVHLTKYLEPSERPTAMEMVEGRDARFTPDVTDETDTSKVANVVYAVYKHEKTTVVGTARDDDPKSPWSTVSLGREIASRADYSEEATQSQADAKAAELLRSSHGLKRHVRLKHVYTPLWIGDAVRVDYPSGEVAGKMGVRTMRLTLEEACPMDLELTSYVR